MEILMRRQLLPSDPSLIHDIVKDTGFFRPEEEDIARELADESLKTPGSYDFIFAAIDGNPAGYICYSEIPGTVGSYELYWLAVYKKLQGRGIGKRLIAEAETDIKNKGGRRAYISTSGSALYNHTRALYEKVGYTKAAVLEDFYLPGDDQVIYCKKL